MGLHLMANKFFKPTYVRCTPNRISQNDICGMVRAYGNEVHPDNTSRTKDAHSLFVYAN